MKRALLFSGQGAQQVGMGQDLASIPDLSGLYHQADALLGYSLSQISFAGPEEKLTTTAVCQPALYVHGYALLSITRSKIPDFQFTATAGLSLGEYTAHAAAGTFDFITGLKLVNERAKLMQEACERTDGGMLTLIGADEATAEAVAREADIDVANFNCPGQIVLSGPKSNLPKATEIAKAKGLRKIIPLNVAGAYHSRLMHSAETALIPHLQAAALLSPKFPVATNFTGKIATDPTLIRDLLAKQVTGSVRWESCIRTLIEQGIDQFVEFGPGTALAGMIKRIDPTKQCLSIGNLEQLEKHLGDLS